MFMFRSVDLNYCFPSDLNNQGHVQNIFMTETSIFKGFVEVCIMCDGVLA